MWINMNIYNMYYIVYILCIIIIYFFYIVSTLDEINIFSLLKNTGTYIVSSPLVTKQILPFLFFNVVLTKRLTIGHDSMIECMGVRHQTHAVYRYWNPAGFLDAPK